MPTRRYVALVLTAITASLGVALPAVVGAPAAPTAATRPVRTAGGLIEEAPDKPAVKVGRNGAPDRGFMRMHERYVQQAKNDDIDLYLLGDSITDFWEHAHKADWDKNFAGWKAADFGISGDRTQHVLWRLQNGELDTVKPKVIVLLIGTNNLPSNATYAPNTVDDTFKGVKAIVDLLREKEPQAHILLIAVFPREDDAARGLAPGTLDAKVKDLNGKIATLTDDDHVKFLNINDQLTDKNGKLIPDLMRSDHLHPQDKGYDVWANAMKPILTGWLGPRSSK